MRPTAKSLGGFLVLVVLAVAIWLLSSTTDLQNANAAPAPAAETATPFRSDAVQAVPEVGASQRVEATPAPETSPATTATVMVRGRVLDSRGQPLASVPVHLCAFAYGRSQIGDRLPEPEILSDPRGAFAFPMAVVQNAVTVTGEGFCTLRTTPYPPLPGAEVELVLVAAPAVDLAGRVCGSDGMPLSAAQVQIDTLFLAEFPLPLEHTVDPRPRAVATGDDGRFLLPRTPLAAGVDLLFSRSGFESKRVPSLQAASGFLEVTLTSKASAPGRITGTVLDAAGHAVQGAELRLGYEQQTKSSADGAFEFEYPQRPSRLVAARPGFLPVVRERVGKDTPMPLLLEFHAPALGISGRVVDAVGAPVPNMLVNLVDPTRVDGKASLERLSAPPVDLPHGALCRSDAEGRFAITGLADRSYRLRAYAPDTLVSVQSEPIAAGSTDVVLTVPADVLLAELSGLVVGTDGRGLAKVAVGMSLWATMGDGVHSVTSPTIELTDAAGRFLLHKVPRQHTRLVLTGEDLIGTLVPIEQVLAEPEHRLEVLRRCFVQIEGPLDIEVRFADAAGKELFLGSETQGMGFSTNGWRMRAAKSPVLTLAETAVTMVWSKSGKELGRKVIAVEPGKDKVTTLVAGS